MDQVYEKTEEKTPTSHPQELLDAWGRLRKLKKNNVLRPKISPGMPPTSKQDIPKPPNP